MPERAAILAALEAGQLAQAETLLRAGIEHDRDNPWLYERLCEVLRRSGRPKAALAACQRAVSLDPGRAEVWQETGRTLNNLGRLKEARAALNKAIDRAPGIASAHHDLAHVCQRMGDGAAARAGFEKATRLAPEWGRAWYRLGSLHLENEDFELAERCLARAVGTDPGDVSSLTALGVARHRLGHADEATQIYRRALQLDPSCAEAWGNLGISLQDAGETNAAISAYRKALELRPGDLKAAGHLADALLGVGLPREALAASAEMLGRFPGHSGALATNAIARLRLGDQDGYAELMDLERLVMPSRIDVPPGFADLDAFNEALAKHVLGHESLRFEPAGHATRLGHHSGDLLRFEKGPVALLEREVRRAVARYCAMLDASPAHPLARSRPARWRLSLWSVVMESHGHQLPHIHPSAWLSGVYYACLPGAVSEDRETGAGWIEFGTPPGELAGDTEFPTRRFRPREGWMFLFPAYFYHETLPFEGDEQRISLAFDVAPAGASDANIVRDEPDE